MVNYYFIVCVLYSLYWCMVFYMLGRSEGLYHWWMIQVMLYMFDDRGGNMRGQLVDVGGREEQDKWHSLLLCIVKPRERESGGEGC